MKFMHFSVLAALLSIAGVAQAAQQYSATLLGTVNSHPFTFAQTINNAAVSGYSYTDFPGQDYTSTATLWSNGAATALTGHSSPNSAAFSSNLNGQTVGVSWTNMPIVALPGYEHLYPYPNYDGHATLWSQGTATLLPGLYNSHSYASSINNHGQVVGWSLQGQSGMVATRWDNNTPVALGSVAGYTMEAHAINDQGIVVGTALQGYENSAVYWNSQNEAQVLAGISDHRGAAYAVNQNGVISGWSISADERQHATIWVDGQPVDLGRLDGYASYAYGINNHGDVVGSYIDTTDGAYEEYAVLWQNRVAIKLNSLLNPADGLTLINAQGINDKGYIISQGYTSEGWGFYLLAPVPEPSSYALMLAGLTLIGVSRRKR